MKNYTFLFSKTQRAFFTILLISLTSISFSQELSINTPTPLGVFHIDAKGDNPINGIPNQKEQDNDFIIKANGNVGIGTVNPTNKLHIVTNEDFAPLKIEELPIGDINKDQILVIDENNIIKKKLLSEKIFIPNYAIFRLDYKISNILNHANKGGTDIIPMTNIFNGINGLHYDQDNAMITFPKGTYHVELTFKADRRFCENSSYFVDFLKNDNEYTRVSNNIKHIKLRSDGETDGHTARFTNVFTVSQDRYWSIRIGRGYSGDCAGPGTSLLPNYTQLIITKLN